MISRPLLCGLLAAGTCLAADPALLNLIVRDPKVVAGIDIQRARNSPFGQKIVASLKGDDPDFQKLLNATGFDPRRDLREVVLSSNAGNAEGRGLIVASGTFDAARIGRYIESEGGTSTAYRGFDLWKNKSTGQEDRNGSIAFLSGSTALIGHDELVRQAIDRHLGQVQTVLDPPVAAKVQEWSANKDAWFVSTAPLNPPARRPGAPGSSMIPTIVPLESIQEAYAGVRFGSNVEISGETLMRSEQDAAALADVIRFAVSMIRMNQDKPGMEELQKIADTVRVSTSGASTRFFMALPEEAIQKLLDSKARTRTERRSRPEVI